MFGTKIWRERILICQAAEKKNRTPVEVDGKGRMAFSFFFADILVLQLQGRHPSEIQGPGGVSAQAEKCPRSEIPSPGRCSTQFQLGKSRKVALSTPPAISSTWGSLKTRPSEV